MLVDQTTEYWFEAKIEKSTSPESTRTQTCLTRVKVCYGLEGGTRLSPYVTQASHPIRIVQPPRATATKKCKPRSQIESKPQHQTESFYFFAWCKRETTKKLGFSNPFNISFFFFFAWWKRENEEIRVFLTLSPLLLGERERQCNEGWRCGGNEDTWPKSRCIWPWFCIHL